MNNDENRYQDPFEDYKTRLAKKLAHRANAEAGAKPQQKQPQKEGDDVNWFGVKLGAGTADAVQGAIAHGKRELGPVVGKYLDLKRPRDEPTNEVGLGGPQESKKRKKLGFGDFEGW